jgi:hypothetical protein
MLRRRHRLRYADTAEIGKRLWRDGGRKTWKSGYQSAPVLLRLSRGVPEGTDAASLNMSSPSLPVATLISYIERLHAVILGPHPYLVAVSPFQSPPDTGSSL